MTVEWARIGDVLSLSRSPVEVRDGHRYRKVGIYSWGRGMIHYPAVPAAEMGSLRYFNFPAQALVLSNIQAWEQAVAVSTEAESVNFVSSNRFLPYLASSDGVDVKYVRHFLLSEAGLELLKRASPGTQVRNRTLGKRLFEDSTIPLPPIADQRRIAAHLDRMSNLRSVHVGVRAGDLVSRVLEGLDWTSTMSDLVLPAQQEIVVDPTATYRLMGVYGGGRGAIDRGTLLGGATSYKTMNRVGAGQVVFSRLKAFEGAVTLVPDALDGAVASKEFPVLSLHEGVSAAYVSAVIRTPRFVAGMAARSAGIGARRERLSVDGFLQVPVPRATRETQVQIGRLHQGREQVETLAHRSSALRRALLPAARNEIFSAMR